MPDFYGTYVISIEDTGRARLPQDIIDSFPKKAVLCQGEGPYLEIYPTEEWEAFMKEYRTMPRPRPVDVEARMEPRLTSRIEVEIKGKNRLTIPREHREYAGLKGGEILLLGMLDHIRLWSMEKYKASEERRRAQQVFGK